MTTKTIYMNDEEEDYTAPEYYEDATEEYHAEEYTAEEYHAEEYTAEKYVDGERFREIEAIETKTVKNKPRSMSIDSENSISEKPNFKCGLCKKQFLLDKNQKMIRCVFCGYRILFKLRTKSYITYKTE